MFTHTELLSEANRLKHFSLKLTRNAADSDDLLQSTLVRALEKSHLYRDGTNLFSWSSRIMFNLFISGRRRSSKYEASYDPDVHENLLRSEPNQLQRLEAMSLIDAIETLPEAQKDVVYLVGWEGQPYEEAARKLRVPIGTIRSRLARARQALAIEIEGNEVPARSRMN